MDLREFADRFRVVRDPNEVGPVFMIPGNKRSWGRAHAYVWGKDRLVVFIPSVRAANNLLCASIPGLRVEQRGDHEHTISFPVDALDVVAESVGLRRRRKQLTPEQHAVAVRRLEKYQFTAQNEGRSEANFTRTRLSPEVGIPQGLLTQNRAVFPH